MFKRSLIASATAGLVVALVAANPAAAQEPGPSMRVDPTRGTVGTMIDVSGTDCVDDTGPGTVSVALVATAPPAPADGAVIGSKDVAVADDGSWTTAVVLGAWYDVPDGAGGTDVMRVEPGDGYEVRATCQLGSQEPPASFQYGDVPFTVTARWTDNTLPLSVDPTRGPVGTTVHVSGTDCPGGQLYAWLFAGPDFDHATAAVDEIYIQAAGDGTWRGDLTVYANMHPFPLPGPEAEVVPGEGYSVQAICWVPRQNEDGSTSSTSTWSAPQPFEVTAGGTGPRNDDPPSSPILTEGQPQAQPATAVPGDPSYTG